MTSQKVCRCLTGSGSGNSTEFSSCQHYCLQIDEQDALDRLAEKDCAAAAANLREDPSFGSAKVLLSLSGAVLSANSWHHLRFAAS